VDVIVVYATMRFEAADIGDVVGLAQAVAPGLLRPGRAVARWPIAVLRPGPGGT
jgi:hypothetical protein